MDDAPGAARTAELRPAPGNLDQARAWDGEEGEHWAAHAERYDRAVAAYGPPFRDAANVSAGDAVLDVGCGNGETTLDAARAAGSKGSACGVDLSERMLARARKRAATEGLDQVRFVQADAQVHDFGGEAFDVVISRFGSMFFADHGAAFDHLAGATRPGGRLALLAWQSLNNNEWLREVRSALAAGRDLPAPGAGTPTPFGLSDPDWVRTMLMSSGWRDVSCEGLARPFRLGDDADDALEFLSGTGAVRGMLQDLDPDRAASALTALHAALAAHETDDGVLMGSATWLVTARKP